MTRRIHQSQLVALVLAIGMVISPIAVAQTGANPSIEKSLLAVEDELLAEINLFRTDPPAYAKTVLEPLKEGITRIPEDKVKPFETYRVILSDDPADYIDLREGDDEEDSLRVIEDAITALKAAKKLRPLTRNAVLDAAARFYSRDWMTRDDARAAHMDSLGRGTTARLAAFGATCRALENWKRFKDDLGPNRQSTIRVFQENDVFFFVDLPAAGGYRYWSVPDAVGEFVEKYGEKVEIAEVKKSGHAVDVTIDVEQRIMRYKDATVAYPLPLPAHGENVAWGDWSRPMAARGLVCWWVLDPGIVSRGHRKTLLDSDFKYCGIGCTWSRKTGWIATFDATSESLVPLADK